MPLTEGPQSATEHWEAFALALTASLGPFEPVYLAPKFPPRLLNRALSTYLSLHDDELLLAIVDRGGRNASGRCALTSRRIYWTDQEQQRKPPSHSGLKQFLPKPKKQFIVRVADYGVLPDHLDVIATPGGRFSVAIPGGASIELGQVDGRLASALARFLETMGRTARARAAPDGLIDPDLAARAARVLPAVARVTAEARAVSQDMSDFSEAIHSGTSRAVMTQAFTAACIIVYIAMVASGVHWLSPTTEQLVNWGANQGIGVALGHEYWRLLTCVFLHGGLIHVAVNVWSLVVIGPLVERFYGNLAFAVIYLASGVGGSIASLTASPLRVGVGASGAVCGVLGGLVAFLIVHRRAIPKSILKSFRASLLLVAALTAVLGFLVPNIDHQAHLGGFGTGFLAGLLLSRPWPVVKSRRAMLRRLVAPLLIAGTLAGCAYVVAQRARDLLLGELRPQLIEALIRAPGREFATISGGTPNMLILSRDFDDEKARAGHLKNIKALIGRALANLSTLRRVTKFDSRPQSAANALLEAQSNQLAGLRAAERFLEAGNTESLPADARIQAIMFKIGPTIEGYNAVAKEAPSTLILRRDFGDPKARARQLANTRALIERALADLTSFQRTTTSDPLLKNMLKFLVEAQSSQLSGLRAAERFLETGDTKNLNGSGGMLEALTAAKKATQSLNDEELRFLRENKLIRENTEP
jgi:rhomboid protease GluP